MNEQLILDMASRYVKDGAITYDEFDEIYSMLSLREQYVVTDILYKNGIDLIDAHIDDDALVLDVDGDDPDQDGIEKDGNGAEPLYDASLFKDKGFSNGDDEGLILNSEIHQSNEILCSQIQKGSRQALQDLCVKNKRLVDKYVTAYEKKYGNRLDFDDMEQVGFMGLMKAAEKFNAKEGTLFTTYADFWIKQSLSREIMDNGYVIRVPVHMVEQTNKVVAVRNILEDAGVPPREMVSMIASELGCSEDIVRECLAIKANVFGYTSLDAPVGENEDTEIGDLIPIEEGPTVEELTIAKFLRSDLEAVLASLTPKERDIVKLRFGWDGGRQKTLEEIGSLYDVTRERIRQIEAKALRKMRSPSRTQKIRGYLEDNNDE